MVGLGPSTSLPSPCLPFRPSLRSLLGGTETHTEDPRARLGVRGGVLSLRHGGPGPGGSGSRVSFESEVGDV